MLLSGDTRREGLSGPIAPLSFVAKSLVSRLTMCKPWLTLILAKNYKIIDLSIKSQK
jgi:hypothetical protein